MPVVPVWPPGSKPKDTSSGTEWWNPASWFKAIDKGITDWFGGIGGDIASGIEGGTIATIKDIWSPIEGVALILIGGLILMWSLIFYFREPIAGLAGQVIRGAIK